MVQRLLFLFPIFWALFGTLPAQDAPTTQSITLLQQAPPQRGITLPLFAWYQDYDYGPHIQEIAATGANSLNITFSLVQENANSTWMAKRKGRSPSDATLRQTIRQARQAGLKVFLLPIVVLHDSRDGDWRGNLQPNSLDAWFANYELWITHYARLAQSEEVAVFGVGSEFASLEQHTDRWKALISKVRRVYKGKLTYSCNWDHLHGPEGWWSDLDYVGLSSYYELTENPNATQEELNAGWQKWRQFVFDWKNTHAPTIPLLFTEVGYPSMDGGAVYPWDYTLDKPRDWEEQAMAYRAFMQTWDATPEVEGVYFYKWVSFAEEELGYSPKGKPAEVLLREWFATNTLGGLDPGLQQKP
jgi:hypothetical protein